MPSKRKILQTALIALIYLAIWEAVSLLVGKELLLLLRFPRYPALPFYSRKAETWFYAGLTLLRIMTGYAVGVLLGVLLAVLTARSAFCGGVAFSASRDCESVTRDFVYPACALVALLGHGAAGDQRTHGGADGLDGNGESDLADRSAPRRDGATLRADSLADRREEDLCSVRAAAVSRGVYDVARLCLEIRRCGGDHRAAQTVHWICALSIKLRIETPDLFAWTLLIVALSMLLEWLLVRGMRRIRHDA